MLIFRGISKALKILVRIGEIPGRPKNPESEKTLSRSFFGGVR